MHLQKNVGLRPPLNYLTISNYFNRYFRNVSSAASAYGDEPTTTSRRCWQFCKEHEACMAYVHLLDTNECYGFSYFEQTNLPFAVISAELHLINDREAIFYEKICLNVPENCKNRMWALSKISGVYLMDQHRRTLETLVTRRECAERCFFESDFKCLSASFSPTYRNNQQSFAQAQAQTQPQTSQNILGYCALSGRDKLTQPDAFLAAPYDEEYIENQCQKRASEDDTCSYELYADSSFIYAELKYFGLTQKECQTRCTHETTFYCQGATFQYLADSDTRHSQCALHSEDIVSLGPRSLYFVKGAAYMRRVKCLNVQVHCTLDEMSVRYTPREAFHGRMYVSKHSETCVAYGNGTNSTTMRLAIGSELKENRCSVLRAYEMTKDYQRTFISALVVIQNNANVQTQSDRLIKVGCIFSNTTQELPAVAALGPTNDNVTNTPWYYDNAVTVDALPKVTLKMIDLDHQRETNDAQLGQELELQIIAENKQEQQQQQQQLPDFRIASLIAKTSDEQNLVQLIDEHGCPTDENIFPGFVQIRTNTEHKMSARFRAFKFSGTPVVNFDATLQFCAQFCMPINCFSNEKRRVRRQTTNNEQQRILKIQNPIYIATVIDNVYEREQNDERQLNITKSIEALQMPLSYHLHVHGPDAEPLNGSGLVYGERGVLLVAGVSYPLIVSDEYCLNKSLIYAFLIFFAIVQVLLLFSCGALFYKYKRLAKLDEERRQLQEDYMESRRVHWADQNSGFIF